MNGKDFDRAAPCGDGKKGKRRKGKRRKRGSGVSPLVKNGIVRFLISAETALPLWLGNTRMDICSEQMYGSSLGFFDWPFSSRRLALFGARRRTLRFPMTYEVEPWQTDMTSDIDGILYGSVYFTKTGVALPLTVK